MTFQELLKALAVNEVVQVDTDTLIKFRHAGAGKITTVKLGVETKYKGCAVRWQGMKWDTWYYAEDGTDKRKHYMSELKLIKEAEPETLICNCIHNGFWEIPEKDNNRCDNCRKPIKLI